MASVNYLRRIQLVQIRTQAKAQLLYLHDVGEKLK